MNIWLGITGFVYGFVAVMLFITGTIDPLSDSDLIWRYGKTLGTTLELSRIFLKSLFWFIYYPVVYFIHLYGDIKELAGKTNFGRR